MERPIISKKTSFNPKKISATIQQRSRPGSALSRSSSRSGRSGRPFSADSGRSPSTGMGPASLNVRSRKENARIIGEQNLKMVNSLLQTKPCVPRSIDLQKRNSMNDEITRRLTQVRYGAPKPYQQIVIRIGSAKPKSRRATSAKSRESDTAVSLTKKPKQQRPQTQLGFQRKKIYNTVAVNPNVRTGLNSREGRRPRINNTFNLITGKKAQNAE
jgi:O6-methylguanine-DNA--protein-cysteine methyltransferase